MKSDGSSAEKPLKASPEGLFTRKLRWSRFVLLLERWWPCVWPPIGVAVFFVLASFLGLWLELSAWTHIALLAVFVLALALSFIPMVRVAWPSREDALRRIETRSGLPHRPASSYYDTLSQQDEGRKSTSQLWAAHRQRMADLFARMSAGWPNPQVHKFDPYALRALIILTLPLGFLWAGDAWRDRLTSAFRLPDFQPSSSLRLDAWVTPPLYTGKAPVLLTEMGKPHVTDEDEVHLTDVPENSELVVRINGEGASRVRLSSRALSDAPKTQLLEPTNKSGTLSEFKLKIGSPLSIDAKDGSRSLFGWNFNIIDDEAPKISLIDEPKKTVRGSLKLSYAVEDDYGVVGATASFSKPVHRGAGSKAEETPQSRNLDGKGEDWPPLGEPPVVALSLPQANVKKAQSETFKDLTSHPWAGLEVDLVLSAKDQMGQETKTPPRKIVLPERKFNDPFARAIIEQRKALVSNPKGNRLSVATAIDALTVAPDKFIEDKLIYLGLRSAHWRLVYKNSRESVQKVSDLLWNIALRIEDGDLSDAERDLNLAKQNLEKALKENAPDEEIKKALDEFRAAVAKYLEALTKQADANKLMSPNLQNNQGQENLISPQDLDQMLKNIENLAKSGSKEMAQKMLSELNNMLQNLQAGQPNQNQQAENMMNALNELSEVIQKQQKLLDDTYKQKRAARDQRGREGERRGDRQGQRQDGQRQGQQQGAQRRGDGQPQAGQNGQQQQGRSGQGQQPGQQLGRGQQGQQFGRGQGQRQGQGQGQQFGRSDRPQPGQQGSPGGQGNGGAQGGLSQRQGDLKSMLGQMLDKLKSQGGQAPPALGEAEQAMGDAQSSLDQDNLQGATEQQTLALDRLRKGAQSMAQQMMQAMQGQGGRPNKRDPLGRRPQQSQGPDLGTSVKVPDQIDIQRARQILEELRRRLSEPTRPPVELDYIERLLRRF